MRTANVDGQLLGLGAGVALGGTLLWVLVALGTGSPQGFLVIALGGGLGYLLAESTVERGFRLIGVALALTLAAFLLSKFACGFLAGDDLLASVLREDEQGMRRTVYAQEVREMVEIRRAPAVLEEWLRDTSEAPSEKLRMAVDEYISLARQRFEQRPPEEQDERVLYQVRGLRVKQGIWGGLRLFLDWIDILWLSLALGLAGYLASGALDKQIVHLQVDEVPEEEEKVSRFLDLDLDNL